MSPELFPPEVPLLPIPIAARLATRCNWYGNIGMSVPLLYCTRCSQNRVNEKTKTLSERLSTLESQGLRVVFKEFEGENHVSVLPILISHAVRFALIPKA
ncbi:hypothetical protein AMI01nite_45760 [Aneurinibacillus migulanus]|nr:hypothetical protein [Aneurinibacillus migulanus]GED16585.1 hypothetical protein AMI01nite_45760 [Aneurinibacillus migulanus]